MNRGEVQVLISSLHVISSELHKVEGNIPQKVYDELEAMERFLKNDWNGKSRFAQSST